MPLVKKKKKKFTLIDVFSMRLDRESASHVSIFLFLFLFKTMFSHGFWSVNRPYALCMGSTTSLTSQISGGQCTLMGPVHYLRDSQISFFNNFFHYKWVTYARKSQISFFSNFFITNESHNTIHTFKNYFATVFLVFSKISGIC